MHSEVRAAVFGLMIILIGGSISHAEGTSSNLDVFSGIGLHVSIGRTQDPSQVQMTASADPVLDSLNTQLNEQSDPSKRVELMTSIARRVVATDVKSSLDLIQEATLLADEQGTLQDRMLAYRIGGILTTYVGLNSLSANMTSTFLELALEAEDEKQIAYAYFNLAGLRTTIGENKKALDLFEESLKRLQAYHASAGSEMSPYERVSFDLNMGLNHKELGEFETAERYFKQGIEFAVNRSDLKESQRRLIVSYAMLLNDMNRSLEALELIEQALSQQGAEGDMIGYATALLVKGTSLELAGRNEEALATLAEGYGIGEKLEYVSLMQHYSEALARLYEAIGQSDSSLFYLTVHHEQKAIADASAAREEVTRAELLARFTLREKELTNTGRMYQRLLTGLTFLGFSLLLSFVWYTVKSRKRVEEARGERIEKARAELKQALRDYIESGGKGEWSEFETRFESVYGDFYAALHAKHANLTLNERRLTAFLRLDMTTKEIAVITGQTVRAVELGRGRLRKKLGLAHTDVSVFKYLSSL